MTKHPADRPWWRELWALLTFEVPTKAQRRHWYEMEQKLWPGQREWPPKK